MSSVKNSLGFLWVMVKCLIFRIKTRTNCLKERSDSQIRKPKNKKHRHTDKKNKQNNTENVCNISQDPFVNPYSIGRGEGGVKKYHSSLKAQLLKECT